MNARIAGCHVFITTMENNNENVCPVAPSTIFLSTSDTGNSLVCREFGDDAPPTWKAIRARWMRGLHDRRPPHCGRSFVFSPDATALMATGVGADDANSDFRIGGVKVWSTSTSTTHPPAEEEWAIPLRFSASDEHNTLRGSSGNLFTSTSTTGLSQTPAIQPITATALWVSCAAFTPRGVGELLITCGLTLNVNRRTPSGGRLGTTDSLPLLNDPTQTTQSTSILLWSRHMLPRSPTPTVTTVTQTPKPKSFVYCGTPRQTAQNAAPTAQPPVFPKHNIDVDDNDYITSITTFQLLTDAPLTGRGRTAAAASKSEVFYAATTGAVSNRTLKLWRMDIDTDAPSATVPSSVHKQPIAMTMHLLNIFEGHQGVITSVAATTALGGPHLLATTSDDCTARLWRIDHGACVGVFSGHASPFTSIAFNGTATRMATGGADGSTKLYCVNPQGSARHEATLRSSLPTMVMTDEGEGEAMTNAIVAAVAVTAVTFHPFLDILACAAEGGAARLWDLENSMKCIPLRGSSESVGATEVSFSPDGSQLAVASSLKPVNVNGGDGHARRWTALGEVGLESVPKCGRRVSSLVGHVDMITCVRFSPASSGSVVVTGSCDGTVKVWQTSRGKCIATASLGSPVLCVAFSADGRIVVASTTVSIKAFWLSRGAVSHVTTVSTEHALMHIAQVARHPQDSYRYVVKGTSTKPPGKDGADSDQTQQHSQSLLLAFTMVGIVVPSIRYSELDVSLDPIATTPTSAVYLARDKTGVIPLPVDNDCMNMEQGQGDDEEKNRGEGARASSNSRTASSGPPTPHWDAVVYPFALKLYHPHVLDDPLIKKELQQTHFLFHKNIVSVLAFVEDDRPNVGGSATARKGNHKSKHSIVGLLMEYCDVTLEQLLSPRHDHPHDTDDREVVVVAPALPSLSQRLKWLVEVASALEFAHASNIVHSDIKPENIFISVNPVSRVQTAKLTDFGSAFVLSTRGDTITAGRGTPLFTAPEYAQGITGPTIQADVFSFGMTIWCTMFPARDHGLGRQGTQISLALASGRRPPLDDNMGATTPPERCVRQDLAQLIRSCWEGATESDKPRPQMSHVKAALDTMARALSSVAGSEHASLLRQTSPSLMTPTSGSFSSCSPKERPRYRGLPCISTDAIECAQSPFYSTNMACLYRVCCKDDNGGNTLHAYKRFHHNTDEAIIEDELLVVEKMMQHFPANSKKSADVVDNSGTLTNYRNVAKVLAVVMEAPPTEGSPASPTVDSPPRGVGRRGSGVKGKWRIAGFLLEDFDSVLLPRTIEALHPLSRVRLLHHAATALAFAHHPCNVVHTDVKPGSILLEPCSCLSPPGSLTGSFASSAAGGGGDTYLHAHQQHHQAKLSDFGMRYPPDQSPLFVAPGDDVGNATKAADVFCFGMTMCCILFPESTHSMGNSVQMGVAFARGWRPPLPKSFQHELLVTLMTNCWSQKPSDRPSMQYVAQVLQQHLIAFENITTTPPSMSPTARGPLSSQRRVAIAELGDMHKVSAGGSAVVYKCKYEGTDHAAKMYHVRSRFGGGGVVLPSELFPQPPLSMSSSSLLTTDANDGVALQEIELLQSLQHRNIVRIVALVEGTPSAGNVSLPPAAVRRPSGGFRDGFSAPKPAIPIIAGILLKYCAHGTLLAAAGNEALSSAPWQRRWLLQIVSWLSDAAKAIVFLHAQDIVHGDVKPENILIDDDDRADNCKTVTRSTIAKLSDFGSCVQGAAKPSPYDVRPVRSHRGTPLYMAPEAAAVGPTKEGDVFSFGLTIWRVLFQDKEHGLGSTSTQIAYSLAINRRPPLPSHVTTPGSANDVVDLTMYHPLEQLMSRCWSHNPAARPTMEDVVVELQRIVDCYPSPSPTTVGAGPMSNPVVRQQK